MPATLFDVNVWVALAFSTHPFHAPARAAFESCSSDAPAVFCRATQHSLLRLLTTPAIQKCYGSEAISNELAWERWARLSGMPQVLFLGEPPELEPEWALYARTRQAAPKRWMDAYLAAFAVRYGIPLLTLDRDFLEFAGIEVRLLQDEEADATGEE